MIDLIGDFSLFSEKYVVVIDSVRYSSFSPRRLRSLYNYYKMTFPDLEVDIEAIIEQFRKLAEYFRPMTIDTVAYLNQHILDGSKRILVEGANATMLDIDFGTLSSSLLTHRTDLFRNVPVRDIVELQHWRRLHRPWTGAEIHRRDLRSCESVYDTCWRWGVSNGAEERKDAVRMTRHAFVRV